MLQHVSDEQRSDRVKDACESLFEGVHAAEFDLLAGLERDDRFFSPHSACTGINLKFSNLNISPEFIDKDRVYNF